MGSNQTGFDCVIGAEPYFDTVAIQLFGRLPKEVHKKLLANCEKVYRDFIPWGNGMWAYVLSLHRPNRVALELLASQSFNSHRVVRVHLALDLLTRNLAGAQSVHRALLKHLVPNKKTRERTTTEVDTTYFGFKVKRGTQVAIYTQAESRVLPQAACCHVEYRVLGGRALKLSNLRRASDLLDLDLRQFFAGKIQLVEGPSATDLDLIAKRRAVDSEGHGEVIDEVSATHRRPGSQAYRSCSSTNGWFCVSDLMIVLRKRQAIFGRRSSSYFKDLSNSRLMPARSSSAVWRTPRMPLVEGYDDDDRNICIVSRRSKRKIFRIPLEV